MRLPPGLRQATAPIALGHLASMAVVAGGAVMGVPMPPMLWAAVSAMALLAWVGMRCLHRRGARPTRTAGLALGSFLLTSLHGAGVALVPALLPLCVGPAPAFGAQVDAMTQPLLLIASGLVAHTAAMLFASGCVTVLMSRALRPSTAAHPGR